MKTIIVSLLFTVLLTSCDGTPEQIGTPPGPITKSPDQGGDGTGSGSGTNDVPIDGGLSILLVAGAAYGVKKSEGLQK